VEEVERNDFFSIKSNEEEKQATKLHERGEEVFREKQ
jgi:hypothetical protein